MGLDICTTLVYIIVCISTRSRPQTTYIKSYLLLLVRMGDTIQITTIELLFCMISMIGGFLFLVLVVPTLPLLIPLVALTMVLMLLSSDAPIDKARLWI